MALNREEILKANDLPAPERLEVPEWGGEVYVRVMTGVERDAWEAASMRMVGRGRKREMVPKLENARARLCAICLCDEKGDRLFSDQDVMALGKKSAAALDRVLTVAQRVNGITQADVDELEGNSGADQSGDSGSGSSL